MESIPLFNLENEVALRNSGLVIRTPRPAGVNRVNKVNLVRASGSTLSALSTLSKTPAGAILSTRRQKGQPQDGTSLTRPAAIGSIRVALPSQFCQPFRRRINREERQGLLRHGGWTETCRRSAERFEDNPWCMAETTPDNDKRDLKDEQAGAVGRDAAAKS